MPVETGFFFFMAVALVLHKSVMETRLLYPASYVWRSNPENPGSSEAETQKR